MTDKNKKHKMMKMSYCLMVMMMMVAPLRSIDIFGLGNAAREAGYQARQAATHGANEFRRAGNDVADYTGQVATGVIDHAGQVAGQNIRLAANEARGATDHAGQVLGQQIDYGANRAMGVSADIDARLGQRIGQGSNAIQKGIQGLNGFVRNADQVIQEGLQGANGVVGNMDQVMQRGLQGVIDNGVIGTRVARAGAEAMNKTLEDEYRRHGILFPQSAPKKKSCELVTVGPQLFSYIAKHKDLIALAGHYASTVPNDNQAQVNLNEARAYVLDGFAGVHERFNDPENRKFSRWIGSVGDTNDSYQALLVLQILPAWGWDVDEYGLKRSIASNHIEFLDDLQTRFENRITS